MIPVPTIFFIILCRHSWPFDVKHPIIVVHKEREQFIEDSITKKLHAC
jgi:hypothetical protein